MFKYRAKNLKGEWVKGSKLEIANSAFIVPENTKWVKIFDRSHIHCDSIVEINPSTLGVCWGMKDKNGKDVYTGMRVRMLWQHDGSTNYDFEFVGKVIFVNDRSGFMVMDDKNEVAMPFYSFEREGLFSEEIEIIEED